MNRNKLSRRSFLQMTGLTAAGAALAACAAPEAQTGAGGEEPAATRSLRFWMWNTYAPDADNVLEEGIQAWADENGVELEISRDSDSDFAGKVMPALEAGTLPDAFFIGTAVGQQLMEAGALATLSDTFTEIGEAHGGWQPRLEGYVRRDGEIYFLPYSIDTPMVHFRQDIFEEAGIDVPEGQWTWEQTRDLCLQAQQYTEEQGDPKVGWGFGVVKRQHDGWCEDLFRNMGADLWDETGQRIILAEEKMEEAKNAIAFAQEAWEMGLFPDDAAAWDWSSNNTNYQEEQGILVINSASIFTWAQENKPELAEVTGLAPKPAAVRDTTNASLRYTVVMSAEAENADTARELIPALYSSDIYAPWLEMGFVTNVVQEYDEMEMWSGKRAQFNLAAQIGVYPGYPAPHDNAAIGELSDSPNAPIGDMMVRVLIDGWEPERAIEEADTFAKRTFEKYF